MLLDAHGATREPVGAVRHRGRASQVAVLVGALVLFTVFLLLGLWQVQRLGWKQDLIARVDARVHATAVPAPAPTQWAALHRDADEYRRVAVTGTFLHAKEAQVQASTVLGAGYWVITPLQTPDGWLVLVNRGFIASRRDAPAEAGDPLREPVRVQGLLRMTEPGGGFLRHNDAAADRWYSRDVAALAASRGLPPAQVAPYFIDAEATPGEQGGAQSPVPGLTVIRFPNNHLVYALTWFALALMVAAAAWYVRRSDRAARVADGNAGSDDPCRT